MSKKAPASAKSAATQADILSYRHPDRRKNNPEVGMVTPTTDPFDAKTRWAHDPHLDPTLSWTGKTERTRFAVDTVSLHVHERIDPASILSAARKVGAGDTAKSAAKDKAKGAKAAQQRAMQPGLFDAPFESLPLRDAIDFYKHDKGWSNRLVAGDSLLVMNSLLQKEGMAGQVQAIYFDPPYGIKYGSNFQPFVNKRDVKDRKDEDLTQEPEMIKAFRDTWELGIHSYLTYLRDRLLLAKELLSESGQRVCADFGREPAPCAGALRRGVWGRKPCVANYLSEDE
jgi:adenine-specific DNA-methyltransferase